MTNFHIQVPASSYDYVLLPTMAYTAAISTGWLVAGEWLCSNLLLKRGAVGPWGEGKEFLATALGGVGWMASLGFKSVDLRRSQSQRCLLGTGLIIFGSTILGKHWSVLNVLPKVAGFAHIASGLFLCITQPKGISSAVPPPNPPNAAPYSEVVKK